MSVRCPTTATGGAPATVAQLVELVPSKHKVIGSIPICRSCCGSSIRQSGCLVNIWLVVRFHFAALESCSRDFVSETVLCRVGHLLTVRTIYPDHTERIIETLSVMKVFEQDVPELCCDMGNNIHEYIGQGRIFVMNEAGKTIADYWLGEDKTKE